MPIEGGEARALASGMAWDMQPRYSPDGKWIAFTSDRGGGDNFWIMDANGGTARQITKESFRLLNKPEWHPNGRYVAGRKHFTTRRSLGAGEIWFYSLDGGDGVQLVKRPGDEYQKELGEPAFSPDGKYLYYSQNVDAGQHLRVRAGREQSQCSASSATNWPPAKPRHAVSEPGGASSSDAVARRPLARVRASRAHAASVRDCAVRQGSRRRARSGSLYLDLDRDMQETWAINGLYPNMDWTPDSKTLVFWAGGGIKRIDVASGAVSDIPFHVKEHARRDAAAAVRRRPSHPTKCSRSMARFASVSPDGKQVVFESFGRLWLKDVADGAARRLTRDEAARSSCSLPGRATASASSFVRWTDAGLGEVHVVAAGGGSSRAVIEAARPLPASALQPGRQIDRGRALDRRRR